MTVRREKLASIRPPSINEIMESSCVQLATDEFGRSATIFAVRALVSEARAKALNGEPLDATKLGEQVLASLRAKALPHIKPVFNLTGIILHTNLGRATLAAEAIEAAVTAMRDPVSLEFDLTTGERGERDNHIRDIICELTGAEDATVVNNNAAALMLVLNSLARSKETIISRGELIEIGASFRLPEIMMQSETKVREVGTTNRTHGKDYKAAVTSETALFLKVHTSNYVVKGFTKEVSISEMALIAHGADRPLVCDLGSGTLLSLERFGLAHEPTVAEIMNSGADLVTFSGDKLLGGPQAGFIVGKKSLIEKINRNPMKRAMRVDKIRLAAIEATLRLYRNPETLVQYLPTYRFLCRPVEQIRDVANRMAGLISSIVGDGFVVKVEDCEGEIGSGALPLEKIASVGVVIRSTAKRGGRDLMSLSSAMRALPFPVIGRIDKNALILDMRCLENESRFSSNIVHLGILATCKVVE